MVKHITPAGGNQAVMPVNNVLALRARDPWKESTDKARKTAMQREIIVNTVEGMLRDGITQNKAVNLLLERAQADINKLPGYLSTALKACAKASRTTPTRSTVCNWVAAYKKEGLPALLPDHKGRVTADANWWGPALEYYNVPGGAEISTVHRRLVEVDGFAVSYEQVRNYINSVPAMFGKNSPARIGKNLYRLTQKQYIRRSTMNALPGDVWVADGYRADVYLAHPMTGDIWRPELTVAMDLRSRHIVGWRADEHEGTIAVQGMWAEAIARWNHVPPFLYVDNGSGYKNRLMDDENVGFYHRVGVQEIIHSIPGNPHGKGWIERFFKIVKEDFLKVWQPQFYCGTDMANEVSQRIVTEVKAKRLQPPSLEQFIEAFNQWLDRYHQRPHPENKHEIKADVWAQLVSIPPHATVHELKHQVVELTVRRAVLKHGKREYGHPDLHAFNGKKVQLEYDLMDNRVALVRTLDGRWICDANLIKQIDALGSNRLQEKNKQSVKAATKRLEKKIREQQARAGQMLDVAPSHAAIIEHEESEQAGSLNVAIDSEIEGSGDDINLDFDID